MLTEVELQTGFTFVAAFTDRGTVTESVALHPTALGLGLTPGEDVMLILDNVETGGVALA